MDAPDAAECPAEAPPKAGGAPILARAERGWHPEDIKAALRKRHGRAGDVTALADAWGCDRTLVSKVIARPGCSRRVEKLVAEALGHPPHVIWPDRWHADGTPKRVVIGVLPDDGRGRGATAPPKPAVGPAPTPAPARPHRQKERAV